MPSVNQTNLTESNESNSSEKKLIFYFELVAISTGILGNVVSFFIFIRPNLNRKSNTGFLYAILCVLNVLRIVEYDLYIYTSVNRSLKNVPCFIENIARKTLNDALTWMQALISFDRFILIIFPQKAYILAKQVFLMVTDSFI